MAVDKQMAFPSLANEPGDKGMTLRDWFAGRAMAAFIVDDALETAAKRASVNYDEALAKASYAIADAMLAERAKGGAA